MLDAVAVVFPGKFLQGFFEPVQGHIDHPVSVGMHAHLETGRVPPPDEIMERRLGFHGQDSVIVRAGIRLGKIRRPAGNRPVGQNFNPPQLHPFIPESGPKIQFPEMREVFDGDEKVCPNIQFAAGKRFLVSLQGLRGYQRVMHAGDPRGEVTARGQTQPLDSVPQGKRRHERRVTGGPFEHVRELRLLVENAVQLPGGGVPSVSAPVGVRSLLI